MKVLDETSELTKVKSSSQRDMIIMTIHHATGPFILWTMNVCGDLQENLSSGSSCLEVSGGPIDSHCYVARVAANMSIFKQDP